MTRSRCTTLHLGCAGRRKRASLQRARTPACTRNMHAATVPPYAMNRCAVHPRKPRLVPSPRFLAMARLRYLCGPHRPPAGTLFLLASLVVSWPRSYHRRDGGDGRGARIRAADPAGRGRAYSTVQSAAPRLSAAEQPPAVEAGRGDGVQPV